MPGAYYSGAHVVSLGATEEPSARPRRSLLGASTQSADVGLAKSGLSPATPAPRHLLQAPAASCDTGARPRASRPAPVGQTQASYSSVSPLTETYNTLHTAGVSLTLGPSGALAAQLSRGATPASSLQICLSCAESPALPCAQQRVCVDTGVYPSCFCADPANPVPSAANPQCLCARGGERRSFPPHPAPLCLSTRTETAHGADTL